MDDAAIVVSPTRWLSWNLASMEILAGLGVDPTEADSWFLADK